VADDKAVNHAASPASEQAREHGRLPRGGGGSGCKAVRSAIKTQRAEQAEVGAVERREPERLSMLTRMRAYERQRVAHQRFPHLPYRFIAPVAEVAARPRTDDLATPARAIPPRFAQALAVQSRICSDYLNTLVLLSRALRT
jgi:hypothetical protein